MPSFQAAEHTTETKLDSAFAIDLERRDDHRVFSRELPSTAGLRRSGRSPLRPYINIDFHFRKANLTMESAPDVDQYHVLGKIVASAQDAVIDLPRSKDFDVFGGLTAEYGSG